MKRTYISRQTICKTTIFGKRVSFWPFSYEVSAGLAISALTRLTAAASTSEDPGKLLFQAFKPPSPYRDIQP